MFLLASSCGILVGKISAVARIEKKSIPESRLERKNK